jgi:hypothetical protein
MSLSFAVFPREESTETCEIRQCGRCPDDGCHRSGVWSRRPYIFAGSQPREPRVSFVTRDVQGQLLDTQSAPQVHRAAIAHDVPRARRTALRLSAEAHPPIVAVIPQGATNGSQSRRPIRVGSWNACHRCRFASISEYIAGRASVVPAHGTGLAARENQVLAG